MAEITHSTECLVLKMKHPNAAKREWLDQMSQTFRQAVQLGLNAAQAQRTSSRAKLHKAVYRPIRKLGVPSDYARMAVNATVSLARSFYGLRKTKQRASFPTIRQSQGIGLGVNAYTLRRNVDTWVLRVSTGKRGQYLWLPLCVPLKYLDRLSLAYGDAKIFQRGEDWYVMLPIRVTLTPAGCSGQTFIGVDLGIVRHAVIAMPDKVVFFNGKPARHRREHFADLRRRYGQHRRTDRIKTAKGHERAWMRDLNHNISHEIVNLAAQYPNPVIVLERLDGIRSRVRGSKRFNRMMASWTFRQLVDFIIYKATRLAIHVVFCDARKSSQTCSRCGYSDRSNRSEQANFRCSQCGYTVNADLNAARVIAARGPMALTQGPLDTAQPNGKTGDIGLRPDGASGATVSSLHQTPTSQVPCWKPRPLGMGRMSNSAVPARDRLQNLVVVLGEGEILNCASQITHRRI